MQFYERNEMSLQNEKDALDKRDNSFGVNADMLYLQPGTTQVRILPPYSDKGIFFKEVTKHRVRVGKRTEIFVCPMAEAGLPCLVCEKGQELTDSLDEVKMEFARENLRPRNAYLYNVICHSGPQNRKNETPEFGKVYCMEAGVMVHKQIIALDQDPACGWADLTTVGNGVNLMIKRTGQRLNTEYNVSPHGAGRTDIFAQLTERGIDPMSLVLFDLDKVYDLPPVEKQQEVVKSLMIPSAPPTGQQPIPVGTPAPTPTPVPAGTPAPAPAPSGTDPIPTGTAAPAAPIPQAMPLAQPDNAAPAPAATEETPAPPVIPGPPTE